jgi:hypothetical protein
MRSSGVLFDCGLWTDPQIEPHATILYDQSRYGNDGTFKADGEPNWVWDGKCWVMDFDGSDDKVTIAAHRSLQTVHELTIAFWLRLDTAYDSTNLGFASHGSYSHPWNIATNGDARVWSQFRDSGGTSRNGTLTNTYVASTTGAWWHLVFTLDSGWCGAYVNGQLENLENQSAYFTELNVYNENMYIGCYEGPNLTFDGQVANFKYYNYALNLDEINKIYGSERYLLGV